MYIVYSFLPLLFNNQSNVSMKFPLRYCNIYWQVSIYAAKVLQLCCKNEDNVLCSRNCKDTFFPMPQNLISCYCVPKHCIIMLHLCCRTFISEILILHAFALGQLETRDLRTRQCLHEKHFLGINRWSSQSSLCSLCPSGQYMYMLIRAVYLIFL